MTGEKDAQVFAEMTGLLREEMTDPFTRELLDDLRSARTWMRDSRGMEAQYVEEAVASLNAQSNMRALVGEGVVITGKLRPNVSSWDDEAENFFREYAERCELGPLLFDAKGPYFDVLDRTCICGELDLSSADLTDRESLSLEINLALSPGEDDDLTHTNIVVDIDDIETLNPTDPSVEMIALRLERDFPKIFAKLQTLPTDSTDEAEVLKVLERFILDIDAADYPHESKEDMQKLPFYIDEYITDRLKFDGGEYGFIVQGLIISLRRTAEGTDTMVREISEPLAITGKIGHIRLANVGAPDLPETAMRYILKFTMMSRVRGGGNQYIEVPANSVNSIKNLSNDLLFPEALSFDEDQSDEGIIGLNEVEQPPESAADSSDDLEPATPTPESAESEQDYETITPDGYIEMRIQFLEETLQKIHEFMVSADEVCALRFDTPDEARAKMPDIQRYAIDKLGFLINESIVFAVEGGDLRTMPITSNVTVEDGRISLDARTSGVEKGDDLFASPEHGKMRGIEIGLKEYDNGDLAPEYGIVIYMTFADDEKVGVHELADTPNNVYYEVKTTQFFKAELSTESRISIPVLSRLHEISESIDKLANDYDDASGYADVPGRLSEMTFINDQRRLMPNAVDVDLSDFHELFERVADNPDLQQRVSKIVSEILSGSAVEAYGDLYSDDGVLHSDRGVDGIVVDLYHPHSGPAAGERVLLVRIRNDDDEEEIVRLPFDSIKRMGVKA